MPTCPLSTVKLIDRSGSLSRERTRIKLTLGQNPITKAQVIAGLQILDDANLPSPAADEIALGDTAWQQWGTCEAGQGAVVVNGTKEGERIFLITKLRERAEEYCCEPVEVVCGATLTDFTVDELLLLIRRLMKLTTTTTPPARLDCAAPTLPG